jgi:hypothetical protein
VSPQIPPEEEIGSEGCHPRFGQRRRSGRRGVTPDSARGGDRVGGVAARKDWKESKESGSVAQCSARGRGLEVKAAGQERDPQEVKICQEDSRPGMLLDQPRQDPVSDGVPARSGTVPVSDELLVEGGQGRIAQIGEQHHAYEKHRWMKRVVKEHPMLPGLRVEVDRKSYRPRNLKEPQSFTKPVWTEGLADTGAQRTIVGPRQLQELGVRLEDVTAATMQTARI